MNKQNFFSATKLTDFLKCGHIIYNDFFEKEKNLKKIEISNYQKIRLIKGDEHEDNCLKLFRNKYSKIIDIKNLKFPENDNYENIINLKIDKTIQSMKKGVEVIRGGWLKRDNWRGEIDFLVKNNEIKSNLGNYSYDVIDAKNSIKSKPEHIIQLGIYAFMLESFQGRLPSKLKVALKNNYFYEMNTDEIYDLFLNFKNKYEIFVNNNINDSRPEKVSFCNICRWADECEKIWIKNDDLNQVIGVNKVQKNKLFDLGINTMNNLSKKDENITLKGFNKSTSKKIILQSKLQQNSIKLNKNSWVINNENIKDPYKGFNLLNKPSKCDLYFDMESVEDHIISGGLEYLFGIFYIENDIKKFVPFWSHNKEDEKKSLIKLFDFFENHFKKFPDSKIYHYNHYEITALSKLTYIHNIKIEKFDNFLRNRKFIDLYPITRQGLFISENSYSLKNMEIFYEFKREGEIKKADISQEYYVEWLETEESLLLDEIEKYNKQDCESTYELHKWLLSIKPKNSSWYQTPKEDNELKIWEMNNQELKDSVKNSLIENEDVKELLYDIVGFYRRENNLTWREHFERQIKDHDELMDDPECIGNLKLKKTYNKEDENGTLMEYEYQDQEFKRKIDDKVVLVNNLDDNGKSIKAGKIENIDYTKNLVTINTVNENLPDIISLSRLDIFSPDKLENSTEIFIESYINNDKKYSATKDILQKNYPNINGIKQGEKIVSSIDFKSITEAISKLNNSYLYVQGPPGSGKTTYSANTIVELLKKRKKIFVLGNSHEVINNLLRKVEIVAIEQNIEFEGFKVSSKKDYKLNGTIIEDVQNDRKIIDCLDKIDEGEISLGCIVGGTKYLFSSFDEQADFIFIDEAGQLSIADLISIGRSSKNIILIGDQNQVASPLRAEHPGHSGISILDHLLEGLDTIPENRGIFLNKTFRMNENINNFISQNFYDGRLNCDDVAKNRLINLDNSLITSQGINYIQMNHFNNVQTSKEEFVAISNILENMIGLEFIDNGNKRKLELEDFLVISPFNTQVNFLKSSLANQGMSDLKVGTIDKFQGQEAPVVIISMASSDSNAIPRNKEFFFSKNRLNVAISRAQASSIILFNPKLLEGAATNVETMKLMNNFFKLTKYKIMEA